MSFGIQQSMPYASGETLMVGDRISNWRGRVGRVTHITFGVGNPTELSIRWMTGLWDLGIPLQKSSR